MPAVAARATGTSGARQTLPTNEGAGAATIAVSLETTSIGATVVMAIRPASIVVQPSRLHSAGGTPAPQSLYLKASRNKYANRPRHERGRSAVRVIGSWRIG